MRENELYLRTHSGKFRKLLKQLKMKATSKEDQREVRWAMGFVARKIHGASNCYQIPNTMHMELDILREILSDKDTIIETPIAHIVPRDPTFVACTVATPTKIVGWSVDLNFWWSYDVSSDITKRVTDGSVKRQKKSRLMHSRWQDWS